MTFFEEFDAFLAAHGVKHFKAKEVCPVGKLANGVGPALKAPPRALWPNIVPTLLVADKLRAAVGPIAVNSGYRDPAYNKALDGSASASQHTQFRALDLRPLEVSPGELYSTASTHPAASWMGIGKYKTFVHIDTRGTKARW